MNNVPLIEYPRPQLKRDSYICLNGIWNYAISRDDNYSGEYDGNILVPYPIESKLSGVEKRLNKGEFLYYKREFNIDEEFIKDITLLHFNAVDQICDVYLNDVFVGHHEGGYLPFEFNISGYIKVGTNTLSVKVKDDLCLDYPYGKQRVNNKGMWYTPVSGIWQTVWLESVSNNYIRGVRFTPDIDNKCVGIDVDSIDTSFHLVIKENGKVIYNNKIKNKASVELKNMILWDTNNPFLYTVELKTKNDKVESYFGMRKFSVDDKYIYLNNKPIYLNAVLDQGYFSDGIYTPSSYKEYEKDILATKNMGFNALRKHIKVEPLLFYYYCDVHGMLVMQDMVNIGKYSFLTDTVLPTIGFKKRLTKVSKIQKENFISHSIETINHLYNIVSLGYYTIFNEGWGQFESDKLFDICKGVDDSRIYDSTSGWFRGNKSDVESKHIYFRPIRIKKSNKPIVISEFGGYSHKVEGHTYNNREYGYKRFKKIDEFKDAFTNLYRNQVIPSISKGVVGSVYTQLSDIEEEINGLLTYDRLVCKIDTNKVRTIMDELFVEFEKRVKM